MPHPKQNNLPLIGWPMFILAFLLSLLSLRAAAESKLLGGEIHGVDVPVALAPWVGWVLQDFPERQCPRSGTAQAATYAVTDAAAFVCQWPGVLQLQLQTSRIDFQQQWRLYAPGWVPLPGALGLWPASVLVDGQPAQVIDHQSSPFVWLAPGEHAISGELAWFDRPRQIQLPSQRGLVRLVNDQGEALQQQLDAQGRLWLDQADPNTRQIVPSPDQLKVEVFRRVDDLIPLQMETRLRLQVSGSEREVVMGKALLPGFRVLQFASPLPARIEDNGDLRIQVKSGQWELVLHARALDKTPRLKPQADAAKPWPENEWWSLQLHPELRRVEVAGPTSIDPSQVGVPANWRHLPLYPMTAKDELLLTEPPKTAENPSLAQGQLRLKRSIWPDFAATGATLRDQLNGHVGQQRRLDMRDALRLGQVTLDGQPQLITRQSDQADGAGVALRQQQLDLQAVLRQDQALSFWGWRLPVSGWSSRLEAVETQLNLPPGWRLFTATGADRVMGSWLLNWTLWDVFLVLLFAVVSWRLLGHVWGLVALLAAIMAYPEVPALIAALLVTLPLLALYQQLPAGRFLRVVSLLRWIMLSGLALAWLTIALTQVRLALYPQLAYNRSLMDGSMDRSMDSQAPMPAAEAKRAYEATDMLAQGKTAAYERLASIMPAPATPAPLPTWDAQARIQTGPGVPAWRWDTAWLQWHGPIDGQQTFSLYLLSPGFIGVCRVLMVLLLAAVMVALFRLSGRSDAKQGPVEPNPDAAATPPAQTPDHSPSTPATSVNAGLLLVLAGLLFGSALVPTQVQAETFPPAALLDELKTRLLAAPDCVPDCVSEQETRLVLDGQTLRITQQISALTLHTIALPAHRDAWMPDKVLLDGVPTDRLRLNAAGFLDLVVQPGLHQLVLEGSLLKRDQIDLRFAVKPHRFDLRMTDDWMPLGLIDGLPATNNLQFKRVARSKPETKETTETAETTEKDKLFADVPPPFVQVERILTLGHEWQLTTRVSRIAPAKGTIDLMIPLLPGEQPTASKLVFDQQQARVVMADQTPQVEWTSFLQPVDQLAFKAGNGQETVDIWQLNAGPQWHVAFEGLMPITQFDQAGQWRPAWRPRADEALQMKIAQATAVSGSTLTLDALRMNWSPGQNLSKMDLSIKLRSSLGDELRWPLPDGLALESLRLDGQELPLNGTQTHIQVRLTPAAHQLDAVLTLNKPVSAVWSTPHWSLPWPLSNLQQQIQLPDHRWLLWTSGPGYGPAVLYWGLLPVLLLLALVLGRHTGNPLNRRQWLLLGLGLSLADPWIMLLMVGWFYALSSRRTAGQISRHFNLYQVALGLLTLVTLLALIKSVPEGLLGSPDMWVTGNGSWNGHLVWTLDRQTGAALPVWTTISAPLWLYRGLMLLWALWLAISLVDWLRWGWHCYTEGGIWRAKAAVQHEIGQHKTGQRNPVPAPEPTPEPTPALTPENQQGTETNDNQDRS